MIWNSCTPSCESVERIPFTPLSTASMPSTFTALERARSNAVNVDGMDAVDNGVNGIRSTLSQEGVQEFQIITNGYEAEFGRASGGVVNIITKSGTNDFHGSLFGYLRNRNFQAQ